MNRNDLEDCVSDPPREIYFFLTVFSSLPVRPCISSSLRPCTTRDYQHVNDFHRETKRKLQGKAVSPAAWWAEAGGIVPSVRRTVRIANGTTALTKEQPPPRSSLLRSSYTAVRTELDPGRQIRSAGSADSVGFPGLCWL